MTSVQSGNEPRVLEALVGVCTFGGMVLLVWAGATDAGVGLGLAVLLWVVAGVLSVGLDEDPAADATVDDRVTTTPSRAAGSADGAVGSDADTTADALAKLRERYARGEVTETEFERRVERLLATDGATDEDGAVRALRMRYAGGDLSDEQFERKLERLSETRTLEDATDTYEREESSGG